MLSSSKKLSEEISVKQEIATKTEEEIDKTRGGYKPVSARSFHVNSHNILIIYEATLLLPYSKEAII